MRMTAYPSKTSIAIIDFINPKLVVVNISIGDILLDDLNNGDLNHVILS